MNKYLTVKDNYCFFLKGELSQWWKSPFTFNTISYINCEQWMMYNKAILFGDFEIANKILKSSSPSEHKQLGRMVKNFNPKIWDENKYNIVSIGNMMKFDNNPNLKEILISTRPYKLVEANGKDNIWGIGKYIDNPTIMNTNEWGQNLLGNILTEIRDRYIV